MHNNHGFLMILTCKRNLRNCLFSYLILNYGIALSCVLCKDGQVIGDYITLQRFLSIMAII